MGTAYGFIRFSTVEQADGVSYARQVELVREWAEKNGHVLDDRLYYDPGKSAFRGRHLLDKNAGGLATFLHFMEHGKGKDRVAPGSFLVVENTTRLTRQQPMMALSLVSRIVAGGVQLVVLTPNEVVIDGEAGLSKLVPLLVEIERGHGESKEKQRFGNDSWQRLREGKKERMPGCAPLWLEWVGPKVGGHYGVKAGWQDWMTETFRLLASGYMPGAVWRMVGERTPQRVNRDGELTTRFRLSKAGFDRLIRNPAVFGHCRAADRILYPPVITKEQYYHVQSVITIRPKKTRFSRHLNVFKGLVYSGGKPVILTVAKGKKDRVYSHYRIGPISVMREHLDKAVLSALTEIRYADVYPADDGLEVRLANLLNERDTLRRELDELADAGGGNVKTLVAKMTRMEARVEELDGEMDAVRDRMFNPITEDTATFLSLVRSDMTEDTKARLSAVLPKFVRRVDCRFDRWQGWVYGMVSVSFLDTNYSKDLYLAYGSGKLQWDFWKRPAGVREFSDAEMTAVREFCGFVDEARAEVERLSKE